MWPLLLLLVAEVISLNPLCDQTKTHPPENVNVPADYIFVFDQGLIQDKSERWRYVVKAMTCNLMEHTDVNLAIAEKKGAIINLDQWEKPSNFEARLLRVKGNADRDVSTCPTASSLSGLPIEPNRPTHLVVLVDTNRTDCADLDSHFNRIFHNSEVVLDRVHIGPTLASDNLKITQHWEDIDTAVSTLPDDHSFANLSNQDTHESLQDQITNWIGGRPSQWARTPGSTTPSVLRRSLKNETITVAINETANKTTIDYSTTENLTTIETVTVVSSNLTMNETLETTILTTVANETEEETTTFNQNVTIIGIMTNETTTVGTATNSTWENGTRTEEAAATMAIMKIQNGTEEADKAAMMPITIFSPKMSVPVKPTPQMKSGGGAAPTAAPSTSSTTEKPENWKAETWLWITQEYELLIWLLLGAILLMCLILLCCWVICVCHRRRRKGERCGKNKYLILGGDLYTAREKEEEPSLSPSGSDSDTCVVPVPEEKRALISEQSEMQETQQDTDTKKLSKLPATEQLSSQPPSTEPASSQAPKGEPASEKPPALSVPHPAEGAVEPYSPALPSPFEVRHSDVAVTPVRTVTSFIQRGPQRTQQPPTALLQKKAATPKRTDVFDL